MQTATARAQELPETAEANPHAHRAGRPIDLVHLSKFTMGRRDLEAEILGLFRQQLAVSVAKLGDVAKDEGNDKAWREAAHTLKGSARGVGAWDLADASQAAEQLDDPAARIASIPDLETLVVDVTTFIDELLEDWQA